MAENLLPCPFCGSSAHIERVGDRRQSTIYQCDNCSCSLETGEEWGHGTEWNRRTALVPSPALEANQQVIGKLRAENEKRTKQINLIRQQRDHLHVECSGYIAELKHLMLAYVNLLELGRDRIIQLGGSCDPVDVMEASDPALRRARAALTPSQPEPTGGQSDDA